MNIGMKWGLAGSALIFLMGATEINIGVNNRVNTGTITSGCKKGDGKVVKEQRPVGPFDELAVDGVFRVNISCGPEPEVFVTADKNLHPLIETAVSGRKLSLSTSDSYCTDNFFVVDIVQRGFGAILADGSSELTVDCGSFMNDKLSVELRGTSAMKISGTVKSLDLHVREAAEFDGSALKAENIAIKASDAAVARLNVSVKLAGTGTDASEIHYRGNPRIVQVDVQDAGEIVPEE